MFSFFKKKPSPNPVTDSSDASAAARQDAPARKISADLIVVGHRHLDSWTARWWRGSISKALIEHAPCSVLVAITQ